MGSNGCKGCRGGVKRADRGSSLVACLRSVPVGIVRSHGSQESARDPDGIGSRSIRTSRTPTPCRNTIQHYRSPFVQHPSRTRTRTSTTTTRPPYLPRTCAWIITHTCAYLIPPYPSYGHPIPTDLLLLAMQEMRKRRSQESISFGVVV